MNEPTTSENPPPDRRHRYGAHDAWQRRTAGATLMAMPLPTLPVFVGRAADREVLAAALRKLRDGLSATLAICGGSGMGKTRLLQEMAHDAAGIRVLMLHGYQDEVRLGFAALQRLLLPLLEDLPTLAEPQQDALSAAFGLREGPPPNRFLVGLATSSLLRQAAISRPLLCIVDDFHWIDKESQDALVFVARRLDAEGVGLVLGIRSDQRPASLVGIPQHQLLSMTDEEMRCLLLVAAQTFPAPQVANRLVILSEGNPLALLEYLRSLSSEQLMGSVPLPAALPISERLFSGFVTQIERFPPATRELLLIVAAGGADGPEAVSDTCARLGIGPDAAAPAVRQSILVTMPRLMFRLPFIRSVVYANATTAARSQVHSALAEVARDHGLADDAAWHRACATNAPDEDVAAELELTAARARKRGGYATEARFFALAAQRSSPGSREQIRRLLAASAAHRIAGSSGQAVQLLRGLAPSGTLGAEVVAARVAAMWTAEEAHSGLEVSLLKAAADSLPPGEVELARTLRFDAFFIGLETRQYTEGATLPELARSVLNFPWVSTPERTPTNLILHGLATRSVFGYQAAAPSLKEALRSPSFSEATNGALAALTTWMAMEDLWDDAFATTTWTEMTALNQASGAWTEAWVGLGSSAMTQARHGNFDVAQDLFDDARSLMDAIGMDHELLWSVETEFRAWQGRVAETRSMADRLIHLWAETRRYGSMTTCARTALTTLELSLGRYKPALENAKAVAQDDYPGHGSRILPDLVEAGTRAGDQTTARLALDELTVRATAAATPWALGVLTRSQALALGTSAEAGSYYEKALHLLNGTTLRTEIARTQLLYGEWLRRRRRRKHAGAQLNASLGAFTEMAAASFARRAALELAATGVIPTVTAVRKPSILTAQEERVAALAAKGMTNAEISLQLFISDSTVDYHLSKVFRKLTVTSRRHLRDAMGR